MKSNIKRTKTTFVITLAILCILSSVIIVNAQTSQSIPESNVSQLTPSSALSIEPQNSSMSNAALQVLDALNSGFNPSAVYVPASETQQRSITNLNNVLNLDTAQYHLSLDSEKTTDTYFGLAQNRVEYTLTSEQESMRIAYTYTGTKLHQIYISDRTNPTPQNPQTTELENTKTFLTQYKTQTQDPLYDTLRSMLTDVSPNENITKTQGNIKLDITHNGDANTNFIWTYVDPDGNIAQTKNIVISYDNNRFQCFQDNWDLYQIAGTPQISEKEAIEIALAAVQTYQYSVSTDEGEITVSDFAVASVGDLVLSYLNEFSADTRGDVFELYPSWYVPIGFDTFYRGGVTGVVVRVWADNGQVSSINPIIYNIEDPETTPTTTVASSSLLSAGLLVAMLGTTISCFTYVSVVKKRSLKVWTALPLCGLIAISLLAATGEVVSAIPNSKAEIYTSHWEQVTAEKTAMATLTSSMQSHFSATGYDTTIYNGIADHNTVIANIGSDKVNYVRTAVFHFGHMAGAGNYRFSDTSALNSSDVNTAAGGSSYQDKHFFAFMWACNTADGAGWTPDVNNLAKSWSQRSGLSSNGYSSPDSTGSCFIGFDGASPMLTGAIYTTTTVPGLNFINMFYLFALDGGGYSVHDSLNQASLLLFSLPFDNNPLWLGTAETSFPGTGVYGTPGYQAPGDYPCVMKVYGNSRIYLAQYYATAHYDSVVWGAGAVNNPSYVHGAVPNGAYTQLWGGNPGDGGAVISTMTTSAGSGNNYARGNIYVYGYSVSGYTSHLHVYVSKVGYNDWTYITDGYISSASPGWYNLGRPGQDFKYIVLVGIDDQGLSCNLMMDAVRVIP